MCGNAARIEGDCAAEAGFRFADPPQRHLRKSQDVIAALLIGQDDQSALHSLNRFFVFARLMRDDSEGVNRIGVAGPPLENLSIDAGSFCQAPVLMMGQRPLEHLFGSYRITRFVILHAFGIAVQESLSP